MFPRKELIKMFSRLLCYSVFSIKFILIIINPKLIFLILCLLDILLINSTYKHIKLKLIITYNPFSNTCFLFIINFINIIFYQKSLSYNHLILTFTKASLKSLLNGISTFPLTTSKQ